MERFTLPFLALILTLSLLAGCSASSPIRRVVFTETANEHPVDFAAVPLDASAVSAKTEPFEAELPLYKIERRDWDEANTAHALSVFKLENAEPKSEAGLYISYKDGNKQLKLYPNGTLQYLNYPPHYEYGIVEFDDKEAERIIDEFIRQSGFMDTGDWRPGIADFTFSRGEEESIYAKSVTYTRYLDGIPVVGNAHIYAVVGPQKQIYEVSVAYDPLVLDGTVKTASYSTVADLLQKNDCVTDTDIYSYNNGLKSLRLDSVETVYVEFAYDSKATHVQPCYRISGTAVDGDEKSIPFTTLVRAVPDSLTRK